MEVAGIPLGIVCARVGWTYSRREGCHGVSQNADHVLLHRTVISYRISAEWGGRILVYNNVIGVERTLCMAPRKRSCLVLASFAGKERPSILLRRSSPDTTRPWPPRDGTCMVFLDGLQAGRLSSALRCSAAGYETAGMAQSAPLSAAIDSTKFSYAPRPGPDEDSKASGR
jgi:hypothetical protein